MCMENHIRYRFIITSMGHELTDSYKRRYSYLDGISAKEKFKNDNLHSDEAVNKLMDEFNISEGEAKHTVYCYKRDNVWD